MISNRFVVTLTLTVTNSVVQSIFARASQSVTPLSNLPVATTNFPNLSSSPSSKAKGPSDSPPPPLQSGYGERFIILQTLFFGLITLRRTEGDFPLQFPLFPLPLQRNWSTPYIHSICVDYLLSFSPLSAAPHNCLTAPVLFCHSFFCNSSVKYFTFYVNMQLFTCSLPKISYWSVKNN